MTTPASVIWPSCALANSYVDLVVPQGLIIQFAPFRKKQEGLTQAAGRRLLEQGKLSTPLMRQLLGVELQPVGHRFIHFVLLSERCLMIEITMAAG